MGRRARLATSLNARREKTTPRGLAEKLQVRVAGRRVAGSSAKRRRLAGASECKRARRPAGPEERRGRDARDAVAALNRTIFLMTARLSSPRRPYLLSLFEKTLLLPTARQPPSCDERRERGSR